MNKNILPGILLFSLILISIVPTSAGNNQIMYKEEISSFTRTDGATYRWESSREFVFMNYTKTPIVWRGKNTTGVNLYMLDKSNYGQPENVIQPFLPLNFAMNASFLDNGSLSDIEWQMFMMRDITDVKATKNLDPFDYSDIYILTRGNNRRYDLRNSEDYFSVNLEYFELVRNTAGNLMKLRVNTDLSTNNDENGLIIRSAIHIIKRDSKSRVVYEYNLMISRVSDMYRLFNYLDQPFMIVPYKLTAIFLVVYIYMKVSKYIMDNRIRIVKTAKQDTRSDNNAKEQESDTKETEEEK